MQLTEWIQWILLIAIGFLSGSIMFSYHIPKILKGVDICTLSDDKNPGAANVFLRCGRKIGLICLFFDMLKGFWPAFTACQILDIYHPLFACVMVAPVLGHAVAPFQKAPGGKCISTTFGVIVATFSISYIGWILVGLYILFSTVIRLKPMWRRSVIVFTLFGITAIVLSLRENIPSFGLGCIIISCIVIAKHLRKTKQLKRIL